MNPGSRWLWLIVVVALTGGQFPVITAAVAGEEEGAEAYYRLPQIEIVAGAPDIEGPLGAESVTEVIDEHLGELERCYGEGLRRDPTLRGSVDMEWRVSPSGNVAEKDVEAVDGSLDEPRVRSCMIQVVQQWGFPEPADESNAEVSVIFHLGVRHVDVPVR